MAFDISSLMERVARHYLGDPNLKLSTKKELRWGTHGSMKVSLANGTWFNHEEGVGGGVIDLVRRHEPSSLNGSLAKLLHEKFQAPLEEYTAQRSLRQLVAQYDYQDKDGHIRYSVERFEWYDEDKKLKTFRQKHEVEGRMVYSMQGIEPLPFNLPEIIQKPKSTIFIVEGEKKVVALKKLGLVGSCNHGGSKNWKPELNAHFKGRNIIILPDNDQAGEDHTGVVIKNLLGLAASLKILRLEGLPVKGDVVDWIEGGGTRERLIELAKAASIAPTINAAPISVVQPLELSNSPALPEIPYKFRLLTKSAIIALPPPTWLIDGIIPIKSFGVIYGEPGKGKTFVSLDMALSIANGCDWHGHGVVQGSVLYVAGEGVGGLGKRIKAWDKKHEGKPDAPFYAIASQVNMRSNDDVNEILRIIDDLQQNFTAIFIDTVARAILGGDENSSTDMGQFIASCDAIKDHTGATVIGVHHSGKDTERGMRGSSSLLGAVDTCLLIEQTEQKLVTLKMEKQKDAEAIDDMAFDMEVIETGIDQTSIILNLSDKKLSSQKKVKAKGQSTIALQFLRDVMISSNDKIRGMSAVHIDLWKAECKRRGLSGGEYSAQAKAFERSYDDLMASKIITFQDGLVAILGAEND